MKIVLASNNAGKLAELQELLAEGTYVADLFGRWSAHE